MNSQACAHPGRDGFYRKRGLLLELSDANGTANFWQSVPSDDSFRA
jgi:hypothetical protein